MVRRFGEHKYKIFTILGFLVLFLAYFLRTPKAPPADLVVYTYSSFTAPWGPGPLIQKSFEQQCGCRLQLIDAGDGGILLRRLQAEGERKSVDAVVGLNQWDLDEALETLKFRPFEGLKETASLGSIGPLSGWGPVAERGLVPFDWGLLSFNTKAIYSLAKARTLEEVIERLPNKSLVLSDPRTSAPGLSFLFWLVQLFGEEGAFEFLGRLSPKIFTIASGWSSSYGLFQKGQAQAVVSYVTSPLYHLREEKDSSYRALSLDEGLPSHVEFAGVLSTCKHCDRAQEFLRFLLRPEIQKILMEKNYMLPVDSRVSQGTPWDLVSRFHVLPLRSWTKEEKTRILKRWSQWIRQR